MNKIVFDIVFLPFPKTGLTQRVAATYKDKRLADDAASSWNEMGDAVGGKYVVRSRNESPKTRAIK